jgi:hypothetical protein
MVVNTDEVTKNLLSPKIKLINGITSLTQQKHQYQQ